MSRVAKAPVAIPAGVEVKLNGQEITVKGAKGELSRVLNDAVVVAQEESNLTFGPRDGVVNAWTKQVLLVLSKQHGCWCYSRVHKETNS